jgi:type II secretory pathway pseudopilin PulG
MITRRALTLAELVVVLFILAALSSIAVPLASQTMASASRQATLSSLVEIRDALLRYWRDTKYLELDGITTIATEADRFNLRWLMLNPVTDDGTVSFNIHSRTGWNGPYLTPASAASDGLGQLLLRDAWYQPLVVQTVSLGGAIRDVRIVSAGPNGSIDLPPAKATSALTHDDVGDDIYVAVTLR